MHKLPPLSELRAFESAARHLSFKKAAAELGVTSTAISHQIKLLEQYCGRPLFRRRPRPLTLTEAGSRLFPVMRDGLEVFAATIAAVKRDRVRQPLRVTTTNAFASRWLVPRLPHWRKLRPTSQFVTRALRPPTATLANCSKILSGRYAARNCFPLVSGSQLIFASTFWFIATGRHQILKRPRGKDGSPSRGRDGLTRPN
jgi:LysR family glycine cleavage system transcriptional activator